MTAKEEQSLLGQKRASDLPLNEIITEEQPEKEESVSHSVKICSKCASEVDVVTITSIEEALSFLKENDKIKDDSKKIEQSLIPYKLLQDVDACKKCLLDKCTPPNEIKHFFKMLQIVRSEKANQPANKELKQNNVIQVSLKLNSGKGNSDNNAGLNSSPSLQRMKDTNPVNTAQEKETKTIQPIFTTIMQLQNQSQGIPTNNMPVMPESQPHQRIGPPMHLPMHLHQQQAQQGSFSNTIPQLNSLAHYPEYHPSYQPFEKKKQPQADAEVQERNLGLINQALDELKAQIGTMKYCNQLQKNSLSSLFNYMEFFNEQFKTHSYYQHPNGPFPLQQPSLFNNPQHNVMDYYSNKPMPMNIPIGLSTEPHHPLFHSKLPSSSFQSQSQTPRGSLSK